MPDQGRPTLSLGLGPSVRAARAKASPESAGLAPPSPGPEEKTPWVQQRPLVSDGRPSSPGGDCEDDSEEVASRAAEVGSESLSAVSEGPAGQCRPAHPGLRRMSRRRLPLASGR